MMDFGQKLKNKREELHLGVNQLALQSGVSASQISRIENGKKNTPKIETLKKLAHGLRISDKEMFAMAGITDESSNDAPSWATEKDVHDLQKFLEDNSDSMTYGGDSLTEEEKEKLKIAMTQIFWKRHKHD
ncbi:helix-turn-helix domain-containing protein [Lentilactobacillus senioris]|uniref:helix-turn-helix domain-containing protein n=1 Tax=Lentilactobacillus senioris TaxID=931534 RepID=UPI003D2CE94A